MTENSQLDESIDKLLTTLENAVQYDIAMRTSGSRHGKAPKRIHAEARQAIKTIIAEECRLARLDELNDLVLTTELHELSNNQPVGSYVRKRRAELQSDGGDT